jgi:purine-cytosine permease-like protein
MAPAKKKITNQTRPTKSTTFINVLVWIVGVIVALAVGSGMIDETLRIPLVPVVITVITGWIVVIGTILSVILAIFDH